MRILHVVHGLARGGLENGVINLVNGLPKDRFEQAVCCLDVRGELAGRVRAGVPIYEMHRRKGARAAFLALRHLLAEWQPDVVHCRNWNAWPDTALAHWMQPGRRSLVWSFHGFAEGAAFPWRRRVASRLLSTVTDHLAAVCRHSADLFAARTGIAPSRFEVLPNGVDINRFAASDRTAAKAALGLAPDDVLVLTVANLTRIKDHAGLLQAVATLAPASRARLRLRFVGEGPMRADLERLIEAHGLGAVVELVGASDRIAAEMAAADIFVLPSVLEGMSNAILEAMASALPVVARAVGGNSELVVHEETGLLCAVDDVAGLARAIDRLATDQALRERMGKAARCRVAEVFALDAMLGRYAKFYGAMRGQ